MNFGHVFGQHHFERSTDMIIHVFVSWAPIILAVAVAVTAGIIYRSRIMQFVKERVHKN